MKQNRMATKVYLSSTCLEYLADLFVGEDVNHVPNGGKRSKGEAGKLKALGVKPGYPDLTLPRKYGQWSGLAIELKSPTGRVSPEQQEWLDAFKADGYLVGVSRTLEEFLGLLGLYLGCTLSIA